LCTVTAALLSRRSNLAFRFIKVWENDQIQIIVSER